MRESGLSRTFGIVVRGHRLGLGLTQEKLAESAGLHPTYISMLERGVRKCSLEVASRLAAALQKDLSDLVQEAQRKASRARGSKP